MQICADFGRQYRDSAQLNKTREELSYAAVI